MCAKVKVKDQLKTRDFMCICAICVSVCKFEWKAKSQRVSNLNPPLPLFPPRPLKSANLLPERICGLWGEVALHILLYFHHSVFPLKNIFSPIVWVSTVQRSWGYQLRNCYGFIISLSCLGEQSQNHLLLKHESSKLKPRYSFLKWTRLWPAFGRQSLVGSSGGYTSHGYTSHASPHASPRACGARLGLVQSV